MKLKRKEAKQATQRARANHPKFRTDGHPLLATGRAFLVAIDNSIWFFNTDNGTMELVDTPGAKKHA